MLPLALSVRGLDPPMDHFHTDRSLSRGFDVVQQHDDYAAFGGIRLLGVELEIVISSSFMSALISPNSGVER